MIRFWFLGLISVIYFKVFGMSKENFFKNNLKHFQSQGDGNKFLMVYRSFKVKQFKSRFLTHSLQSTVDFFTAYTREICFVDGRYPNMDTPMFQYGCRGLLVYKLTDFNQFLKEDKYELQYIREGNYQFLDIMSKDYIYASKYKLNKNVIGFITPLLFGDKDYIYSLVFNDFRYEEYSPNPVFYMRKATSRLSMSYSPLLKPETKINLIESVVTSMNEFMIKESIFGKFYGKVYSLVGFEVYLESQGYYLNNKLEIERN